MGGKSGATRLQCSQKFFVDLVFGRKVLGQTLLDLNLAMNPRSDNQFLAETFCLLKRVQANILFIKESSKKPSFFIKESPGKLSAHQRESKQTFCLSKRVQANNLFIKENARKFSAYQRESKQMFLSYRIQQTFFYLKRVQENFLSIKESKQTFCF